MFDAIRLDRKRSKRWWAKRERREEREEKERERRDVPNHPVFVPLANGIECQMVRTVYSIGPTVLYHTT
jgi:hypothetical protein